MTKKRRPVYKLKDGSKVKSVTTLIGSQLGWNKQALINWTRKMCLEGIDDKEELREAGQIGTLVHLLIEGHQKGLDIDTRDFTRNQTEQAMVAFGGYLEWAEKVKFKPHKSEMKLVDESWRVGGTADCIGSIGDDLIMLDWKTSKYLYKEHKIQLGAYIKIFEKQYPKASKEAREKKGLKPMYGMVLRFEKEELKFHQHIIKREKIEAGIKAFDNIVNLSHLQDEL